MSHKHYSHATKHFNKLIEFRQAGYEQFGNARDALFELCDAVLASPRVNSFAELSLSPHFRRKWPSIYEALQDGQPDGEKLLELYEKEIDGCERPILAGDHTAWTRLWARKLPGRSFEHQSTPIPGRRPITIGHGYSTLAWVPEAQGSWCLPLLHERVVERGQSLQKGADQLRQVCDLLDVRPITLWDAEYGCAKFLRQTDGIPADKLIRLRTNLCLSGSPPTYKGRGAPRKHGAKFNFKNPQTWWTPDWIWEGQDSELGTVIIQIWHQLHFRQAPECPFTVARITHPQAPGTRRKPKVFWLAWIGLPLPSATPWWQWYVRRYCVDHWYRFAKQRLHWTLPMLSSTQQAERWSTLMPFLTWQLWLARPEIPDCPLPWQKPKPLPSPGRVCQGLLEFLHVIGTPARMPKPRGKSPGWAKGRSRKPRVDQPILQSARWTQLRAILRAKKL